MASGPRTQQEHYQESERLLGVAESIGTDPAVQTIAALTALGHALLAAAPKRARKRSAPQHAPSARDQWMFGRDR